MGPELATIERMAFADVSRYSRAIEVSIRGEHREELAGWKNAGLASFGHIEITTWENPSPRPVIDDPMQTNRIRVSRIDGQGEQNCGLEHTSSQTAGTYYPPGIPLPGDRFNCAGSIVAITIMPVLDYSARRCITAMPAQGTKFRVVFQSVKLGKALHGNHGLYAENEREKKGSPVTIDVSIGSEHVGRATHHDGDGWSYFEFSTSDRAGQTADVIADIASSGSDRNYCFEMTSR